MDVLGNNTLNTCMKYIFQRKEATLNDYQNILEVGLVSLVLCV